VRQDQQILLVDRPGRVAQPPRRPVGEIGEGDPRPVVAGRVGSGMVSERHEPEATVGGAELGQRRIEQRCARIVVESRRDSATEHRVAGQGERQGHSPATIGLAGWPRTA
jgi:hypothetical protein